MRNDLCVEVAVSDSGRHGSHPSVAHGGVYSDVSVPHAKARMTVRLRICLRSAQPANQKQGEPILSLLHNVAVFIASVQLRKRRFVVRHVLVKAVHQRCDSGRATHQCERRRVSAKHVARLRETDVAHFSQGVDDVHVHIEHRLVGLNASENRTGVSFDARFGLGAVHIKPVLNHFIRGVIGSVL